MTNTNDEQLRASNIALRLLGVRTVRRQPNRRGGKQLSMMNKTGILRCLFCEETRALERAHIIPVALYEHININGKLAEIYHHALWMCPTHHKCYDKGLLNEDETKHMRWILSHDYITAFQLLLKDIEVMKPSEQCRRRVDMIAETVWKWWRNNVYAE